MMKFVLSALLVFLAVSAQARDRYNDALELAQLHYGALGKNIIRSRGPEHMSMLTALEAIDDSGAVARSPVQIAILDTVGIEAVSDLAEESGELTEHQCAVTSGRHIVQLFRQHIDLRTRQRAVGGVDESGMECQLSQHG